MTQAKPSNADLEKGGASAYSIIPVMPDIARRTTEPHALTLQEAIERTDQAFRGPSFEYLDLSKEFELRAKNRSSFEP